MPDANAPLWTSDEAAKATGGKALGTWAVNGVSIDSRSLKPGDMFVALKDVRDGHEFVEAAFAAGAGAALVSRDVLTHANGGSRPGLIVNDVLLGLEKLGLAARARTSATCAAVTGSVGKTSVKEMLARIFRAAGRAHWSDKSFNNHWGVPLTLARMPRETGRAIFEIGMNTPGEIAPRSRMVRPHLAMITRIAPAHLQGMGSVEAVADEKVQIFAGLEPGGAVILPEKDHFFARMKLASQRMQPSARQLTYGGNRGPNSATPLSYRTDGNRSTIEVEVMGNQVTVTLDAVGEHWAANASLALLAAVVAGVAPTQAAEALSGYAPPAGRGTAETLKLPKGGEATLVDDAYNANPESMRAAIEGFAQRPGRKIIALGEMRELGEGSAALHAGLAGPIVAANISAAVLSGGEMKHLADALAKRSGGAIKVELVAGPADAAERVKTWLEPGDAVLIKGSNASGMSRVGAALRQMSEGVAKSQKASGT
ncbi:MAG TPA: UDP-N-acetylmuramoyl-tripeptide--D-alanyl-D-alanine ligase [Hyphomonadaceae bacterium]|nr:UDP-N-acetylmuramoyl-tripeptide--D-alanyl-D-alanine ligase [Hyphomonadaceae bacterium]